MLVNPVQQSPFAFDPARQILTPPAPIQPAPVAPPPTAPIQQGQTFQDKSNTGKGGSRGTGGDQGSAQQEEVAQQLQQALLQLEQLREQARSALVAGDTQSAKEAAQEAAQVATSIQNLTGTTPSVNVGQIVQDAVQQQQQDTGPTSGGDNSSDVIGLARTGVNAANDVVDTAASITTHTAENRASIAGYKRQVLDAIAGVEETASKIGGGSPTVSASTPTRLDINA